MENRGFDIVIDRARLMGLLQEAFDDGFDIGKESQKFEVARESRRAERSCEVVTMLEKERDGK